MLPEEGHLLRVLIGESDKHEGLPLYEWIVRKARPGAGRRGCNRFQGPDGLRRQQQGPYNQSSQAVYGPADRRGHGNRRKG